MSRTVIRLDHACGLCRCVAGLDPILELPGPGTALNVVIIGFVADATAALVPAPSLFGIQGAYLVAAVIAVAFFDAPYPGLSSARVPSHSTIWPRSGPAALFGDHPALENAWAEKIGVLGHSIPGSDRERASHDEP